MKAEQTIIKTTNENCHNTLEERLLEQARISFKAGYNEKASQCPDCTLQNFNRGRQSGIKEVVEWIEEHTHLEGGVVLMGKKQGNIGIEYETLKKQLKEWGI